MCEPLNEAKTLFNENLPLITFIAGLIATPLIQRISENNRLKRVEKYFHEILDSLHTQVSTQNSEINKCIAKIEDKNNFDLVLDKVTGRNLELLDRLDSKDLFKIVVLRKKGKKEDKAKLFKELNSIIAFFNESIENAFNINHKNRESIELYRNDWNASLKSLFKLKNWMSVNNNLRNIGKGEDPFMDELTKILNTFEKEYGKDNENIFTANEKLIDPLLELSVNNPFDPRAAGLLAELQNARLACREMEKTRELMKSALSKNFENNERLNENLKSAIVELKKFKNKII